ncbi:helix-turn-helix transcriptional regulator [Mycolicibacterium sp. F2034L]|uniref:helix-turn-helix transcriptional regulator n=1 Tax=Mycolicibacterium sp. F2034L TaxID=2926422 RepID=UPI001FF59D9C|nr:helix-turn-helix transcriptional regulator [Mycolicibacterium sp. F2034L]MCK0174139.1 helix-turn-helix transcriptional regulator [Mycolicibacterium sp. F2034L]
MAAPPIAGQTDPVSVSASPDPAIAPFGRALRVWRERRRLSQLELALAADVSARHISFVETGRSTPSRVMVLRLAETLDVPPRERNELLIAAGLAPMYPERPLDHPDLAVVRAGLARVLAAHEPFPCVAVDRQWNVVATNDAAGVLLDGVSPALLERPNALRIALHPDGLTRRIVNLGEWRHHLLSRLRREVRACASAELRELLTELESYPGPIAPPSDTGAVAVRLEMSTAGGDPLSFLSTVTTFGTALDPTAAELSVETFLPADDATAAALVCLAKAQGRSPEN